MATYKKSNRPKTANFTRSGFRAWSEDEENKVKILLSENISLAEIATRCDRTERAIKMRIYQLVSQDINKGTSPDIVLKKYRVSEEEYAEYNKDTNCKYPECKNNKSPKSTLGYCAEHLNIERVGKNDLDAISTQLKQNSEKIDKLINIVTLIAQKLQISM